MIENSIQHIIDYYYEPKGEFWKKRIQRVLSALRPTKRDFILDLGCGVGTFAFHSARGGAKTVGVDRSLENLRNARKVCLQYKIEGRINFICADATALPFKESVFNKIAYIDFMEHIANEGKDRTISEAERVLLQEGEIVVYTPNSLRIQIELIGEKIKKLLGKRQEKVPRWQDFVDPDHFGMTTPFVLTRLMKKHHLRIKFKYFSIHIPFISRVFPLLGKFLVTSIPFIKNYFADRILLVATKLTESKERT